MGRKAAGNKQSSLFVKLLRRRVQETYGSSSSNPSPQQYDIKQLLGLLRAKYPEYARHNPQLLTRIINQTLHPDNNNKAKRKLSSNNNDEDDITSCKKAKKIDIREQMPSSSSEDGDEDDISSAVVATSEVEFDLTKSMLRNKYNEKPNKSVELEMVTSNRFDKAHEVSTNNLPNDDIDGVGRKLVEALPRFKDLGGMDDLLHDLLLDVIIPFYHPDLPLNLGVMPTAGILLHGPPGCGKTTLASAIANEAGVPFYEIAATEFVSGVSGDSEEKIRELFAKAHKTAPSIVFIDEIDAIASKRDNLQRAMENRIVTQLMICMDATTSNAAAHGTPGFVLVIGATNRPDALDPALRRPGRFDREITLSVPDENARTKILGVLTRNVKLEAAFDPVKISKLTPGFAGADLKSLVHEAGRLSIRRFVTPTMLELSKDTEQLDEYWWRTAWTREEKASTSITMSDFEKAVKLVQPSTKRTGFSSIPDVKWEDIGGLDWLRSMFYTYIVNRIKDPLVYQTNGLNYETGILLYGPPGCGKTLIAQAVANEAGASFIHVKGPELLDKYVGESELKVRTMFSRARTCSPCILFFDEVDAWTSQRGKEGGWVVERLLIQLLTELDGGESRNGVYVIGATNRLEAMDSALLRPGRFGEVIYVPLPNQEERGSILKALSKNYSLDADVDLNAIARKQACENLSGSDLKILISKAAGCAYKEKCSKIKTVHFEKALTEVWPSVSDEQRRHFDRIAKRLKS